MAQSVADTPRGLVQRYESWIGALSPQRAMLLVFLLGGLTALGQAPVDAAPATLLGFALLFGALEARAEVFRLGWAFGAGYFALSLSWIVEPFFVDPWRHGWLSPFAILGVSLGFGAFWAIAAWAARRVAPGRWFWLGVPAAFSLIELARAYILTGFPWAMPAYIWVETPVIQLVSLIGAHGLNALTLGLVTGLYALLRRRGAIWLILSPIPFAVLALAGVTLRGEMVLPASDRPVVRMIQPNAPQHLKWHPDWMRVFFDQNTGFTREARAFGRPDLIVWPETSIPVPLDEAGEAFRLIGEAAGEVPVVAGLLRRERPIFFNSLVVLEAGVPAGIYDKHHLVPFGEYVPGGDLVARLGLRGIAAAEGGGYSAGPGPELLDLGPLGRALPLICYEAIFPQDVAAAPERPDFLLQITNDAWFGEFAGPQQHLAQARVRSIEQGLPMVRVANTGISAMIDTKGRMTGYLPLGQAGFLDLRLPPPDAPTLYAQTGDWPAIVILAATFGLLLGLRRRNSD